MEERFVKCYGSSHYYHEVKKHPWSRWEIERIGRRIRLYIRPGADLMPFDEFFSQYREPMTLHLSLKEKWFRMIQSGEKPEEYREINDYWHKRLTDDGVIKHFDEVHFTLGYPKADDTERHMTRRIADIIIGTGNPEWGAEEGKYYFVIKLKEDWPSQR